MKLASFTPEKYFLTLKSNCKAWFLLRDSGDFFFFFTFVVPLDPGGPPKVAWATGVQQSGAARFHLFNTLTPTALDSLSSIPQQILETTLAPSKNHI